MGVCDLLCLLAPAVCVHNKPLLTIKLQPGQLPGERTLIPSPAVSAALELSLTRICLCLYFPSHVWLELAQEEGAQKQARSEALVFHLLPSVLSGHSHSLMLLGSLATHNTRILQHPQHTNVASFTQKAVGQRKQEQHHVQNSYVSG